MPYYTNDAIEHRNYFNVAHDLVAWTRNWFERNGPDCNAIVGISGGKDSAICAAICVRALGADRVFGVLLPNYHQDDIYDSHMVCEALKIKEYKINIGNDCADFFKQMNAQSLTPTLQSRCNLAPRLRMAALYAISQSLNGRVINTSNRSEIVAGWETRWGDSVGDVAPLAEITASEVARLGKTFVEIPANIIEKVPMDGLPGANAYRFETDEEKMGFSYRSLDEYILTGRVDGRPNTEAKIIERIKQNKFKLDPVERFQYDASKYIVQSMGINF